MRATSPRSSRSVRSCRTWRVASGSLRRLTIARARSAQAAALTVFQRTPNWCKPLHNGPIDAETQARIKANYDEMFKRCKETYACFLHTVDPRSIFEVTPEEREAFLVELRLVADELDVPASVAEG